MSKSVTQQIDAILKEYIDEKEDQIEKITREVAKDTAQELRKTSPKSQRGGKHYASGWKVRNEKLAGRRSVLFIVYNATKPQLTHLLANAHDIKNQYGVYGRSTPDPHLKDADEHGREKLLKRLEREL